MTSNRYYLDTNMLVFALFDRGEISSPVASIIKDTSNYLYTSSIAAQELVLLFRIGKLNTLKKGCKTEKDILAEMKSAGVEIVYFNQHHFSTYASLRIVDGHKDMNDHAIIAQAISDKIPVISSDGKFNEYTKQGLKFVFNKR